LRKSCAAHLARRRACAIVDAGARPALVTALAALEGTMNLVGRRVGNYLIRQKLGEGGMGTVYLCEHAELGRRAALKVLHEDLAHQDDIVERFFHEAKAATEIGNEHIIDVLDFGYMPSETGEVVYILMELLDGSSLGSRLKHEGFTDEEIVHIGRQCCDALAVAHGKGIIHRDLKPENIYLLNRQGDRNFVKILDFGIAKLVGDHHSVHKTRAGVAIGTPAYMSPEQCASSADIDARSDIYAMGVVLYELFTRRLPFTSPHHGEVLLAHLTMEPPRLRELRPDLSPALEAIVLHAMEKNRDFRFQTMEEMSAALADPEAHLARYTPAHPGQTIRLDVAEPAAATPRTPSGQQPGVVTAQLEPPSGSHDAPTAIVPGVSAAAAPRKDTLDGVPAEVVPPPPRARRGAAPIIAAISAIVAAGSLTGMLVLAFRKPAAAPPAPSVATQPAAPKPTTTAPALPELIPVLVSSEPAGATVAFTDAGKSVIGTTPLRITVTRGAPAIKIRVTLDGYDPTEQLLATDGTNAVTVTLTKPAPKPTPTAPSPSPSPSPPTKKTPRPKKPVLDDPIILTPSF
jgi:serine/threonine-protein kinase